MGHKLNQLLDFLSDFLARRKGLFPILGILLVVCNAILQFLPATGWLVETNLLLHLGIIIALVGILLAWAL
jgi:hypothetical protein